VGVDNPVAAIGDKNVAILGLSDRHLPGYGALLNASTMARRVAASPNGMTSMGSGPRWAAGSLDKRAGRQAVLSVCPGTY
jgi:hypothetical protein